MVYFKNNNKILLNHKKYFQAMLSWNRLPQWSRFQLKISQSQNHFDWWSKKSQNPTPEPIPRLESPQL